MFSIFAEHQHPSTDQTRTVESSLISCPFTEYTHYSFESISIIYPTSALYSPFHYSTSMPSLLGWADHLFSIGLREVSHQSFWKNFLTNIKFHQLCIQSFLIWLLIHSFTLQPKSKYPICTVKGFKQERSHIQKWF